MEAKTNELEIAAQRYTNKYREVVFNGNAPLN